VVTDVSKEVIASLKVKYTHLTLQSEGKTSKMTRSAMFKIDDDDDDDDNYDDNNNNTNNLITSVVNVTGDSEDYVTRTFVTCIPHKIFG
jgi:hypothetical protein